MTRRRARFRSSCTPGLSTRGKEDSNPISGSDIMLSERQSELCESSKWDFSDLRTVLLNCTLKRSPEVSHTEGLIGISRAILEKNGITVELFRPRGIVPRSRLGRAGERLYQPQHDVHDVELDAPRSYAQRCRRCSAARKPTVEVGRGVSVRPPES